MAAARKCRNCHRPGTKPRGLCPTCYYDPEVRRLYPPRTDAGLYAGLGNLERVKKLPPRKPGEPPHRCLWCERFLCHGPLETCAKCHAWYLGRAAGMPAKTYDRH